MKVEGVKTSAMAKSTGRSGVNEKIQDVTRLFASLRLEKLELVRREYHASKMGDVFGPPLPPSHSQTVQSASGQVAAGGEWELPPASGLAVAAMNLQDQQVNPITTSKLLYSPSPHSALEIVAGLLEEDTKTTGQTDSFVCPICQNTVQCENRAEATTHIKLCEIRTAKSEYVEFWASWFSVQHQFWVIDPEPGRIYCPIHPCKVVLSDCRALAAHLQATHPEAKQCNHRDGNGGICGYLFTSQREVPVHRELVHNLLQMSNADGSRIDDTVEYCSTCDKILRGRHAVISDRLLHADDVLAGIAASPYYYEMLFNIPTRHLTCVWCILDPALQC